MGISGGWMRAIIKLSHTHKKLKEAGWTLFDIDNFNLKASLGVAIREFPLKNGYTDYLLFVEGQAVGVVEAKPEGTPLIGVSEQTRKYIQGIPDDVPHVQGPLPFAYESTGLFYAQGVKANVLFFDL